MSKNVSKKEIAYQVIKEGIISGILEATNIYTINDLFERFDIGRTPAREALVILASEGLIVPIPRSGYQVKPISVQDLMEIFHLRRVLEIESVGLATERITGSEINILQDNNRQEHALAGSLISSETSEKYRKGFVLNLEFHQTIAKASGNKRLEKMIVNLLTELERVLVHDPYLAEPGQHSMIINQLRERDKLGSQETMKVHLEDTENRTLSRF
ncbi:MAG: hypothetical protein DRI65_17650 [Chloroflexota bacterium]|nr:MAG: hypothetical protein DRI65_17650 [Chloroflexota bacterium]HDD62743.1 GntR family transcriptional regulator [Chloroflexota bacterium]